MCYLLPIIRFHSERQPREGSMAKLTKRVVDQIVPGETDTMHWDDELKGFGLRVWPSGRKVYLVMSRVKGRLRRIYLSGLNLQCLFSMAGTSTRRSRE